MHFGNLLHRDLYVMICPSIKREAEKNPKNFYPFFTHLIPRLRKVSFWEVSGNETLWVTYSSVWVSVWAHEDICDARMKAQFSNISTKLISLLQNCIIT